jgi:hypothetical protein
MCTSCVTRSVPSSFSSVHLAGVRWLMATAEHTIVPLPDYCALRSLHRRTVTAHSRVHKEVAERLLSVRKPWPRPAAGETRRARGAADGLAPYISPAVVGRAGCAALDTRPRTGRGDGHGDLWRAAGGQQGLIAACTVPVLSMSSTAVPGSPPAGPPRAAPAPSRR